MVIRFDKQTTKNFDKAIELEWLETNGLGGWASSTIVGANTRRYHGLLVAATQPPVGRTVLLSKLDETIVENDERFELGCNQYPGAVHPRGFEFLESFEKEFFPVFEYRAGGIKIMKTVAAIHGENTTVILYEVLEAPTALEFELQPFIAARDFHSLTHANDFINQDAEFENGLLRLQPYDGIPDLFIYAESTSFEPNAGWYHNFEYKIEKFRGLDFQEDLWTCGKLTSSIKAGDQLGVIISTEDPRGRDALELLEQERQRRKKLVTRAKTQNGGTIKALILAADQFVVRRAEDLRTIIAGYPWFADWGRDTMIALPGICLVTGRFDDAKKILRAFAQSVSQGMLPNRFPDAGEEPEYNTVDATLWYFVAIHQYFQYTQDEEFVREELMPVLRDILRWHERGSRYNIHMDEDGLLYAGEPGVQLTWMDAKIGDWVVTPRQGKAVEINALWYNALMIFSKWLNGTQSHLDFLPERSTDFVFAVFSEEFGLMGILLLISIYMFIIVRGLNIALSAQQIYGKLLASGFILTFFVYVFVNMGMVTGQLPVVGVPLPLISLGGTSMVTLMIAFGILMAIQKNRRYLTD